MRDHYSYEIKDLVLLTVTENEHHVPLAQESEGERAKPTYFREKQR